ncbi:hypothetical protein FRB94_014373 [Tulasnella sp. JGI-2019a]|nr:hypothetical protein FRB94_014373 [Tulasnella sp. JGI-2019a]
MHLSPRWPMYDVTKGTNSSWHDQVSPIILKLLLDPKQICQVIAVYAHHPSTSATPPPNIATHISNLSNENRQVIAELNTLKSSSKARERMQQAQIKALSTQYKNLDEKH